MAFVFTWLRLSNNRLLDWQRCFSYQPRDITWAQQQVRGGTLGAQRSAQQPQQHMAWRTLHTHKPLGRLTHAHTRCPHALPSCGCLSLLLTPAHSCSLHPLTLARPPSRAGGRARV